MLFPRLNAKNIRILCKFLVEVLQSIPSYQSLRHGYMGFVTTPEEYVLTGEPPWVGYADLGFDRPLGRNSPQQRNLDVTFAVASDVFQNQENVQQAINKALTAAVPEACRRAGGDVGPAVYTPTDDPRVILVSLQRRYGKQTLLLRRRRQRCSGENHGTPWIQLN